MPWQLETDTVERYKARERFSGTDVSYEEVKFYENRYMDFRVDKNEFCQNQDSSGRHWIGRQKGGNILGAPDFLARPLTFLCNRRLTLHTATYVAPLN
mgnify:CR=1 FL=1